MSVITAYKCDHDGKIFEDKGEYQKHLRKLARIRVQERKIEQAYQAEQKWWHDNFWNKVRSLAQLQAAIMLHANALAANGIKNCPLDEELILNPLVKLTTFTLRYSDTVSNSHSAPHNGVENWGNRKPDAPTSYPGWRGSIGYVVATDAKHQNQHSGGSAMWKGTRIHSGTGGGSNHRYEKQFFQTYNYDFILFEDDWPAMKEEYAKAKTLLLLKTPNDSFDAIILDKMVNDFNPAEEYFK